MTQSPLQKEAYLKDLVIKLLRERNFSDFDALDSLFKEVKQELQNQDKTSNSL
ncbi:MAG: hypothetical protein ACW9XA_03765 [Candidatus Nitrosopumilus sp. bin_6a]